MGVRLQVSKRRVAVERILFVLPKRGSKLELFLMRPLRAKFRKNCQWTKNIKDDVVYGWGRQILFQITQRKHKFSKHISCVFIPLMRDRDKTLVVLYFGFKN